MIRRRLLLGALALVVLAGSAPAGIIFNRKSKESSKEAKPQDPAAELVRTLRGDADERRRMAAAEELSKFDLKQYPQAAGALIEALQRDASPNVRSETAESLGKVRPLATQIGQALEQSLNGDASPRVRMSARNSLTVYFRAGYRPAGVSASEHADSTPAPSIAPSRPPVAQAPPRPQTFRPALPVNQTPEPPLANSAPGTIADVPAKPLTPAKPPIFEESPEPSKPQVVPPVDGGKPKQVKPAVPAKSGKPDDDGPILNPPG